MLTVSSTAILFQHFINPLFFLKIFFLYLPPIWFLSDTAQMGLKWESGDPSNDGNSGAVPAAVSLYPD
jgi:hypothetical protein